MSDIEGLPDGAAALVTALMLASARDNLSVATDLMNGYKRDLDRARAELAIIRTHISEMFSGPYLPNPDRVLDALYPNERTINLRMEAGE